MNNLNGLSVRPSMRPFGTYSGRRPSTRSYDIAPHVSWGCALSEPCDVTRGESKCSPYWVQTRTKLSDAKTFTYEFHGGIFTGFKNITSYLLKPNEPISLKLLRKTHRTVGTVRPKVHPISGDLINYGQVPFGYKDINGTLQKEPLEQFVLQQIKKMRSDGSSLNAIAKYLTKSGVPTKNGGRWQSNTVNKIISRSVT